MASHGPASARPGQRERVAAALVLLVLVAGVVFWIGGLPLLILWGLSKATESSAQHFVLGLIAVPTAMAWFGFVLIWLNGIYLRLAGGPQVTKGDGHRSFGGPLELLLISGLLVVIAALFVWFFFFAHGPPRQFI